MVRDTKRLLRIPLAIKLSPFFTAFANVSSSARRRRCGRPGSCSIVFISRTSTSGRCGCRPAGIELSTSTKLPLRLPLGRASSPGRSARVTREGGGRGDGRAKTAVKSEWGGHRRGADGVGAAPTRAVPCHGDAAFTGAVAQVARASGITGGRLSHRQTQKYGRPTSGPTTSARFRAGRARGVAIVEADLSASAEATAHFSAAAFGEGGQVSLRGNYADVLFG